MLIANISGSSDEETGEIPPDANWAYSAQCTGACQETEHDSQILQEQIQEHWLIMINFIHSYKLSNLLHEKGNDKHFSNNDELGQFQEFPIRSEKD